ncbi:MAG: hypothetical protein V3S69_07895, partial [Dehalococcoidales bacterium]
PREFNDPFKTRDYFSFRNLAHFKHVVSKLTQKDPNQCGMSYKKALSKLLAGESDFPPSEQESIRNLVRSNLQKRGLITEEVYEAYRYAVDGVQVGVDVGKYANGEPDCVITPARQYIDFFYEMYVNISYPHHVTDDTIRQNCAKLLATVEELERQHIFIKIAMVFPARRPATDGRNFFSDVPLFSHKDPKSVDTMSSVVNDRLLRKFYFAILENYYGDKLSSGYGTAVTLEKAMNIGNEFNEIEFFEEVVLSVGAQ